MAGLIEVIDEDGDDKVAQQAADPVSTVLQSLDRFRSRDEQLEALRAAADAISGLSADQRRTVAGHLMSMVVIGGDEAWQLAVGACGRLPALEAAVDSLQASSSCSPMTLAVLRSVLLLHPSHDVFHWSSTHWIDEIDPTLVPSSLDPWIDLLPRLPFLLANACRASQEPLPKWATPTRLLARMIESLVVQSPAQRYFAGALVQRLVQRGSVEEVVDGLARTSREDLPDVVQCCQDSLLPREAAMLVQAVVRFAVARSKDTTWVEECSLPLLSPRVQDHLVQRAILSTVSIEASMDELFCRQIATLLSKVQADCDEESDDEQGWSSALERQLGCVAETWSQAAFVQKVDYATQQRVTRFLLEALGLVHLDPISPVLVDLLNGVTERLHSTLPRLRRDGMRVAVKLSRILGHEVHFDELEEDDDEEAEKETTTEPAAVEKARVSMRHRVRRLKQLDPDADFVSDDEDSDDPGDEASIHDDDSEWDDDSAMQPYNLDDDEDDLRQTPRPLYLRDCLDLIRTADNDENCASRQAAVLEALPDLVRSHPADLPDVGPILASELLDLENKFNLSNFSESVSASLLALTIEEPMVVGHRLIADLTETGKNLSGRLQALGTLNEAAYELSGNKAVRMSMIRAPQTSAVDQRVTGKRHLVATETNANDSDPKTRRWGQGRNKQRPAIENRFAQVAPSWFYSLVGKFLAHKDDSSLWSGHTGAILLANVFIALAVIVDNSGINPGTDVLANDLFELVWTFRDAEIAELRASVLSAVATTVSSLRRETLLHLLLNDSGDGLLAYLQNAATYEPDDGCQRVAREILRTLGTTTKAIEFYE